ncbi:protein of unknown function [Candidatus Hydrogenisulfobacillus filiaventi]|uniref:Uncharacterized protein n=1 Tax=Candidatus Hydrogenisulfobacillus filiaventi TaxID=2707344 RepID=A0A6F8ZIN2_9FIRM|nr:protein of unknown function [Candidatus Hydrogenisulfobacillus filiaventi]
MRWMGTERWWFVPASALRALGEASQILAPVIPKDPTVGRIRELTTGVDWHGSVCLRGRELEALILDAGELARLALASPRLEARSAASLAYQARQLLLVVMEDAPLWMPADADDASLPSS